MKKTNKEHIKAEEVEVQTPASSLFCNFINNIDYKKHFKYICWLALADIALCIMLTITFVVMVGNAFDGLS